MLSRATHRESRSFTAGLLLAVMASLLLLAHVAIPCTTPDRPLMTRKFDAMCKPPVLSAQADMNRLFAAVTPEGPMLPLLAAAFLLAAAPLFRIAFRAKIRPNRMRTRIRDGSRLPFCTSRRMFLSCFAPVRDH